VGFGDDDVESEVFKKKAGLGRSMKFKVGSILYFADLK
jgi:hypothetical protein